jgi:hypothetical protein
MTNDQDDEAVLQAMLSTDADARATWYAELADMPSDVIVAFLRERGYVVYYDTAATHQRGSYRIGWFADQPPPGYPPLADDDYTPEALPFDGGDRRP